jgi:dihydrofolate synthase/folylpolyglutamate synthase
MTVDWLGRLQRLTRGPLVSAAPKGAELWLDGAHNPHAARALAHALADLEERTPRPLYLVCGMLQTKAEKMLGVLIA